jgi:hypothetical protein
MSELRGEILRRFESYSLRQVRGIIERKGGKHE